jgi:nitroreductase
LHPLAAALDEANGVDQDTRAGILRAGIAAPSADNSQPWRFAWTGDALDVRIDPDRSGHVSDTRYVLSDLATGACLENMLVHARSRGWGADLEIFPQQDDPLWVARIRWRRDGGDRPEPLAAAIEQRHTDRRFPWRGPISADTRARLDAQARRIPGARLWWPQTARERKAAQGLIREAEALRFKSPTLHAELFSSIRFSAGWHTACEEGLPPAALAVEPPLRPMFQAMRRPGVMATFNRLGAAAMLGWRSAWVPIRLSPGLCLVAVASTGRADVLSGGRALQRVWLQATLEGLSVQPYAAPGVLSLGFVPLEPALQQSRSRLASALGDLAETGAGLVFLRLGYTRSPPAGRSGRRPLASFGRFPGFADANPDSVSESLTNTAPGQVGDIN